MMKFYAILMLLTCLLGGVDALAQREDKITFNEGVDSYRDGNYSEALSRFESAYERNSSNTRALYNAGNAAYLNGDFEKANQLYGDYAKVATSPAEIAKAYFNQGNTFLQQADAMGMDPSKLQDAQKLYKNAANSFKNSLKNNPGDQEAKYNLTYALNKIQQNQEQQDQNQDKSQDKEDGQKPEEKDPNQDQNEDNQDGNNDPNDNEESQEDQQENGDQGDQQEDQEGNQGENQEDQEGEEGNEGDNGDQEDGEEEENQGQGEQGDQEQQEQEAQFSRAQAEQDLDAINEEEGKILKKVYGSRGNKKGKVTSGKDW
jgi:hypothetical protein